LGGRLWPFKNLSNLRPLIVARTCCRNRRKLSSSSLREVGVLKVLERKEEAEEYLECMVEEQDVEAIFKL